MPANDRHDDEGFRLGYRLMRLALSVCAIVLVLQGALDICGAAFPGSLGSTATTLGCAATHAVTATRR